MSKYLKQIALFILALVIVFTASGFVSAQKAEAQVATVRTCWYRGSIQGSALPNYNPNIPPAQCFGTWQEVGQPPPAPPHGPPTGTTTPLPPGTPVPGPPPPPTAPPEEPVEQPSTWWDTLKCVASPLDCALRNVVVMMANIILQLVSLLTGLSAIVLNSVIYHTIVKVSENYSNIGAINETWKVVRDVANMSFIFILLYAAIKTIIGAGEDNQKLIVRVVVVAILINFSLFFTKVVIDISNVLALLFYGAIAPDALAASTFSTSQAGLSNAFMQHMNLQTLYKTPGVDVAITIMGVVTTGIMGSIMLIIAAFVFFAVALMLIIRYVILILVLILSPLAFLGFVLPQTKKYKDQWVDALIGQAFFAPIYFMLTWVTLKVLGGIMSNPDPNAALAGINATNIPVGTVTMFINYIVVIVFLIASLMIAKEWANRAPGGVNKLTSWVTGAAGGATLGLAGRFGRGTLGRAGSAIAENEWLKDKAPTSRFARLGLAASRKTAGASFDVRGTGIGGTLGAGEAKKGGFAADLKKKVEAEKKYADEAFKPSELSSMRAEQALASAKKTGTPADIARAQEALDKITGVSEEALRQRKIKEFRARGDTKRQAREKLDSLEDERLQEINRLTVGGMAQEEAERTATAGWAPKAEKGLLNTRKEAYAKTKEEQALGIPLTQIKVPFSLTERHVIFGPVKKEAKLAANAIRKSIKEKKPGEKIAEEIEKQARESSDETGAGPTAPPTTPPTSPPGGSPTP